MLEIQQILLHVFCILFFSFLQHDPSGIFYFIFFFPTSEKIPCQDPSTIEYKAHALTSSLRYVPPAPDELIWNIDSAESGVCLLQIIHIITFPRVLLVSLLISYPDGYM